MGMPGRVLAKVRVEINDLHVVAGIATSANVIASIH